MSGTVPEVSHRVLTPYDNMFLCPEMEDKEELMSEIAEAIELVRQEKSLLKRKSLTLYDPKKVSEILYLHSIGVSQTRMIKKYGFERHTILSVLTDYADYVGKFREISGRIAAKNYLNLSSLEEDLIERVRQRMEDDPEMEIGFRDLKELSIAKANAAREALTARGEATSITEERKVVTQDDYEETIRAAKERIAKAKQAQVEEVIDVED